MGLPNAILFLRISWERVFQQPQAITRFDPVAGILSGLAGERPLKHPPPQAEHRLHARVCRPALLVLLLTDAASQALERVVFVLGRVSIA